MERFPKRLDFLLEGCEDAVLRKCKTGDFEGLGFLAGQWNRQHGHSQMVDVGVGVVDSQAQFWLCRGLGGLMVAGRGRLDTFGKLPAGNRQGG